MNARNYTAGLDAAEEQLNQLRLKVRTLWFKIDPIKDEEQVSIITRLFLDRWYCNQEPH